MLQSEGSWWNRSHLAPTMQEIWWVMTCVSYDYTKRAQYFPHNWIQFIYFHKMLNTYKLTKRHSWRHQASPMLKSRLLLG